VKFSIKSHPYFLDFYSFIHDYSILDDFVAKKGWLFYRKILSDNFTQGEAGGAVFLEKMCEINKLEVWHGCCLYYYCFK